MHALFLFHLNYLLTPTALQHSFYILEGVLGTSRAVQIPGHPSSQELRKMCLFRLSELSR